MLTGSSAGKILRWLHGRGRRQSQGRAGEVVAVIGPNGAGKTTLFHLITGQLAPMPAASCSRGRTSPACRPRVCRKGIGRSYQVVNIFNRLSVFENVQIAVLARRRQTLDIFDRPAAWPSRRPERILDSVGLLDKGPA
jgi:branched-chain amino acid transport system ATP-binding protein